LGLLPRICFPIWHADLLLGYVWLIDTPESEPPSLDEWLPEIALNLYRENLLGEVAARREADVFRGLCDDDPAIRERAAATLHGDGFPPGPVIGLVIAHDDPAALDQILLSTRRWLGPASPLTRPGTATPLARPAATPWHVMAHSVAKGGPQGHILARTESIKGVAEFVTTHPGARVGIGEPRPRLPEAVDSLREAQRALEVSAKLPSAGRISRWGELGIYRVLATVDLTEAHPGARRLREAPVLARTLETYLDLAGDAAATAARLNLHRTTLYYRLRRIEELTGADLRDGEARLGLHLALKSARFVVD
jgi:hypothetical protein